MISRSRWKCIVAFGSPVVPDVKPSKGDVVPAGRDRLELQRPLERDAIQFRVVIVRAVETARPASGTGFFGARHQLVGDAAVTESEADFGLVHDLRQLTRAQHRHRVHDDRPGLGRGQPDGDERGVVAGADQYPITRLDAVVLDQGVGEAVRPVGEFLVGPTPSVADQRDVIAGTRDRPCDRSARHRR